MISPSRPSALVVGAAVLLGRAAGASPADGFGFGARQAALAGAVSADVRNGAASFYNPSGLSFAEGTELSLGYSSVAYRLELDGQRIAQSTVTSLQAGLVARGQIAGLPFAFGLALELPNGSLSRVRTVREGEPHWVLYETLPELVHLGAHVALRPFDFLALGGGLGFLAATRGGFDVTGTVPLSNGRGSEYDAKLRHEVDAELASVRYPEVGVTIEPLSGFDIALVYREEARLEQHVTGALDGNVDAALLQIPIHYSFESTTVTAFLPRQIVVGTSIRPIPVLHINVDLSWQEWSRYPSPVSSTATTLGATVPAGLPITLPGSSPPTAASEPHFSDRVVPRAGFEYLIEAAPAFSIALRAGYAFEKSPAPRRQAGSAFIDLDRHVLSLGYGFDWQRPATWFVRALRFDTHFLMSEWIAGTFIVGNDARAVRAGGRAWSAGASISLGSMK